VAGPSGGTQERDLRAERVPEDWIIEDLEHLRLTHPGTGEEQLGLSRVFGVPRGGLDGRVRRGTAAGAGELLSDRGRSGRRAWAYRYNPRNEKFFTLLSKAGSNVVKSAAILMEFVAAPAVAQSCADKPLQKVTRRRGWHLPSGGR
jgi:hypothetical protein